MDRLRKGLPSAALLVALLVLSLPAARAPAVVGTVLATGLANPAVTDGHGIVAWAPAPGTVRVLDTTSGRSFDADVRGDCLTPPTRVIAAGGGEVMYACSRPLSSSSGTFPVDEPRLVDVATHAIQVPAGVEAGLREIIDADSGSGGFVGVGAYGLRLEFTCYHCGLLTQLLNWRTGKLLDFSDSQGTATTVPDLDRPSLFTTLCAPLSRARSKPSLYEAPYGVTVASRLSLSIQRCGSARKRVLQPFKANQPNAQDVQLAAGFVSWEVRDVGLLPLYAYLPACRAKLWWRVSPLIGVGHLQDGIVVSEAFRGGGPWRVRQVSFAGICGQIAGALTAYVSAGGKTVVPRMSFGSMVFLPSRASATILDLGPRQRPLLVLPASGRVRLALGAGAGVRWRLGAGASHRARGREGSWSAQVPASGKPQVLTFDVRFSHNGSARYQLRVVRRRG